MTTVEAPVRAAAADARLDPVALREALQVADIRVLLMSLVHVSGEEHWLDRVSPYIQAQFQGGAKNPQGVAASIPDALKDEIRRRLFDVLTDPQRQPRQPSRALMQRMMSICVGEPVGDEFVPLVLEQAGFTGLQEVNLDRRVPPPSGYKVLVIGSGLSGICAGIRLGEAGYDYEILERNEELGGTWYENTYPGVAVDTPSHFYSYSFEVSPEWPHYFSRGEKVELYLQHCAVKYGVRPRIQFNSEVKALAWNPSSQRWQVTVRDTRSGEGRIHEADAVITAAGPLNRPSYPGIPGLEDFKGPKVHTARWDHGLDVKGKRVAVLGVGCSAMQVAPAIVDQTEHLTVFQRTPHWIIPSPSLNAEVPKGTRWAMRHIPYYGEWFRFLTYWFVSDGLYAIAKVDPAWPHQDVSVSELNERRRQVLIEHIRKELEGRPDLIEKVTPQYPPMGKRIVQDNNWYKMLRRDDVSLETTGIDHIEADAIVLRDGRRVEVDVIILATGFVTSQMLHPLHVVGRDGVVLREVWGDEDPRAYLGLTVPGFPNFFVMTGPNSAPNHGAGVNLVSEGQSNYIVGCLSMLHESGKRAMEPRQDVFERYNETIDGMLRGLVWSHPKVSSYYLNSKHRNFMSNPWRLVDYWRMMREPKADDYTLS